MSPFEVWLINIAVQFFNNCVIAVIFFLLYTVFHTLRARKSRSNVRGIDKAA